MAEPLAHEITGLLQAWQQGDERALDKLTPQVYRELHRAAKLCMRDERRGHILQTTALINELYLRLAQLQGFEWQSRAHFYALCARQMRRILTDEARARQLHKRGNGAQQLSLEDVAIVSSQTHSELLAVDEALTALARVDGRKSEVVELRFFGRLSVVETAEVLKVSQETVARDWRLAKAWLLREIGGNRDGC